MRECRLEKNLMRGFTSSCSSSESCFSSYSTCSCFCSTNPWKYHVFLSFRGLDTRVNFADHLYCSLVEKGIKVFRDDKKIGKGKTINEAIIDGIFASRFSIIVLSKNFASSEWCLDELVRIIRCKNERGHVAFPIFYQVNPDDVKNQSGHYKMPFTRHEKLFTKERVRSWKNALIEIAGVSGWDSQAYRSESKLIKSIVERISQHLRCTSARINEQLDSVDTKTKHTDLYLYVGLEKMEIVRICGILGTVGTTIARVVYDAIVNKKWEQSRFQQLVSEMPRDCSRKIWNVNRIINVINNKLQGKKVLVLIDDINVLERVVSLIGRHGWFTPGSRIIVSTTSPGKRIFVTEISFQQPNDGVNMCSSSNGQNNKFLDVACFLNKMDDDDVTRIVRSQISGDMQANNGTKFLISKTVMDISDCESLPIHNILEGLYLDNITRHNLEEATRDNELLGIKSSESIWKMQINPRKSRLCRNQHQDLGSPTSTVQKIEYCDAWMESTSRVISKLQTLHLDNITEESIDTVKVNDNAGLKNESLLNSKECLQETVRLKMSNNTSSSRIIVNDEPKSPETVFNHPTNEGKKVVSSGEMNECDRGSQNKDEECSKLQKEKPPVDPQIICRSKGCDQSLQFFTPESLNGKKIVRIPKNVAEEGMKQWELCLVGQLLGNSLGFPSILDMANKLWGKEGRIGVKRTENNLYLFKFPSERTRNFVLESGPWHMAESTLVLRKWQPKMQLLQIVESKIPVWVKLRGIPVEYMTMQGLSYIASALGKPLYMEKETANECRLAFTKLCVETSVEDELTETIPVMVDDGEELVVQVEYPWKPDKCIICREFGHSTSKCTRPKEDTGKTD